MRASNIGSLIPHVPGLALVLLLACSSSTAWAQADGSGASPADLKALSMEQLMALEVTSVSRTAERFAESASAVQVITGEEIRRSGATNLAEALRLATNLQVARLNAYAWIISARGFNSVFANKLLVMIDGRTVYTPLFGGVSWDVQNLLLEDVDRIEVVSGPGGTLWGANAVNGVINIITRSASRTRGVYATASVGTFRRDHAALRYGARIGENLSFRVYGQRFSWGETELAAGGPANDAWGLLQGGFRMDWEAPDGGSRLSIQGGLYGGSEETAPAESKMNGQNVLASWTRTFSPESDVRLQAYVDRTWRRDIPSTFTDRLSTADLDFQHRFPLARRHSLLWGAGYRLMGSEVRGSTDFVGFVPEERTLHLLSGFVQDHVRLVEDRLELAVGTKIERNAYSGIGIQPSVRLAWMPHENNTVWVGVSRAIRAPSRIDVEYFIPTTPLPPDQQSVAGGPNFESEKLIAYEAGFRLQPDPAIALSVGVFVNRYDDLYSVDPLPETLTYQIQNESVGETWGLEFYSTMQPAGFWRIQGGYTWFGKDLRNRPGSVFPTELLGNDPTHQFLAHSMMDLPANLQFDVVARYGGKRPEPFIADYFSLDARLAWLVRGFEVSVVGRNLLPDDHVEYGSLIPRSMYGRISWRR